MVNLEKLWLKKCKIGNEGAKHLSKAKFQYLRNLDLDDNEINQGGNEILNGHWKYLDVTDIFQENATIEMISTNYFRCNKKKSEKILTSTCKKITNQVLKDAIEKCLKNKIKEF